VPESMPMKSDMGGNRIAAQSCRRRKPDFWPRGASRLASSTIPT
jgi:hypothetical protein